MENTRGCHGYVAIRLGLADFSIRLGLQLRMDKGVSAVTSLNIGVKYREHVLGTI